MKTILNVLFLSIVCPCVEAGAQSVIVGRACGCLSREKLEEEAIIDARQQCQGDVAQKTSWITKFNCIDCYGPGHVEWSGTSVEANFVCIAKRLLHRK